MHVCDVRFPKVKILSSHVTGSTSRLVGFSLEQAGVGAVARVRQLRLRDGQGPVRVVQGRLDLEPLRRAHPGGPVKLLNVLVLHKAKFLVFFLT